MPRGAGYSRGCQDELVRRKQETTNFETKVSLTPVYNGRVVMSYFRKTLDSLRPYEPGEQPAAAESIIKLNTNENPYPASPRAMALLHTIDEERLRRYPTPYADEFRAAAAEILGVGQGTICAGFPVLAAVPAGAGENLLSLCSEDKLAVGNDRAGGAVDVTDDILCDRGRCPQELASLSV